MPRSLLDRAAVRLKTMGTRGSTMIQPGEGATILTDCLFRPARRGGYHAHGVTLAHLTLAHGRRDSRRVVRARR